MVENQPDPQGYERRSIGDGLSIISMYGEALPESTGNQVLRRDVLISNKAMIESHPDGILPLCVREIHRDGILIRHTPADRDQSYLLKIRFTPEDTFDGLSEFHQSSPIIRDVQMQYNKGRRTVLGAYKPLGDLLEGAEVDSIGRITLPAEIAETDDDKHQKLFLYESGQILVDDNTEGDSDTPEILYRFRVRHIPELLSIETSHKCAPDEISVQTTKKLSRDELSGDDLYTIHSIINLRGNPIFDPAVHHTLATLPLDFYFGIVQEAINMSDNEYDHSEWIKFRDPYEWGIGIGPVED